MIATPPGTKEESMQTPPRGRALWSAPKPSIGGRCQFCRQRVEAEQKFCGACGAVLTVQCQRKHASVLYVDVCGFTVISERLDPEDVRSIMERAFDVILDAVHAHGGSVNQFLGDGVMALFSDADGVEDHPVRALSAAMMIESNLATIRADVQRVHSVDFRVRSGVHTGPITVGVIGRGLRNDYVSSGETTSIAARLVHLGHADQIVVSARTRELTKGAFCFTPFDTDADSDLPLSAWIVAYESCDRADAAVSLLAEV
jgi:class 3 adenylate cyclase